MGKVMVNFQPFFEIFLWDLESISLLENREKERWSLLHSSKIVADGIYWFIFSFTEYCMSIGILTHSATYISLLSEFKVTHLFVSQRHNAKCFKGTWIINMQFLHNHSFSFGLYILVNQLAILCWLLKIIWIWRMALPC